MTYCCGDSPCQFEIAIEIAIVSLMTPAKRFYTLAFWGTGNDGSRVAELF
jgi:hypothetical protein